MTTSSFTRLEVSTVNQPGSISPLVVELTAEKLGQILGWNPNGNPVKEILARLLKGEYVEAYTRAVPKARGTDGVKYAMTPLKARR